MRFGINRLLDYALSEDKFPGKILWRVLGNVIQ